MSLTMKISRFMVYAHLNLSPFLLMEENCHNIKMAQLLQVMAQIPNVLTISTSFSL